MMKVLGDRMIGENFEIHMSQIHKMTCFILLHEMALNELHRISLNEIRYTVPGINTCHHHHHHYLYNKDFKKLHMRELINSSS